MTLASGIEAAAFTGCIDLVSNRLGGKALLASDEFFAEKENLIKPGRSIFIADKYTERGKWMDGWESRRKRVPGHDWCILSLGCPGHIQGLDIDTDHFIGNCPAYASVDAVCLDGTVSVDFLNSPNCQWTEILPRKAIKGGSQNIFGVHSQRRWTHVRLNIFPDGGVARFRVYGRPSPHWSYLQAQGDLDLALITNGGHVTACSDMFFGNKDNMIMPGRAANMGEGWETRRRRGEGFDWAVIELAHLGLVKKIEIDTNHFKGNYPDRCWIEACNSPGSFVDVLNVNQFPWEKLLPEHKLEAHKQHYFDKALLGEGPWTHLKLNIAPDGGISRFRVTGIPVTKTESGNYEKVVFNEE